MKPLHTMSNIARVMLVVGAAVVALGANWIILSYQSGPDKTASSDAEVKAPRYLVTVRQPEAPRVKVLVGDSGKRVDASCTTCHAKRFPNRATRSPDDLDEFHQGLKVAHGKLSCLQCHNGSNYDQLALADGSAVEFGNVMELCAQCHGPQMRSFEHGAHGGMTGFWDLSRGPRQRNNCIDCHDPHAPAFPKMKPTFKPKDRILSDAH